MIFRCKIIIGIRRCCLCAFENFVPLYCDQKTATGSAKFSSAGEKMFVHRQTIVNPPTGLKTTGLQTGDVG